MEQAFEDESIDAVWVLTINDTHYEYVKMCLERGKHVVVEKPVTPTSEQAYELAKLAQEKNLVLAVYQVKSTQLSSLSLSSKRLIIATLLFSLSVEP